MLGGDDCDAGSVHMKRGGGKSLPGSLPFLHIFPVSGVQCYLCYGHQEAQRHCNECFLQDLAGQQTTSLLYEGDDLPKSGRHFRLPTR